MTDLLKVTTPNPIVNIFRSLFAQVAAAHGCGQNLCITAEGRYACHLNCLPCKIDQIEADFIEHQWRLAMLSIADYHAYLLQHELYEQGHLQLKLAI